MTPEEDDARKGAVYGFLAYAVWGAFPLYFHALIPAGAWEVLVHRILWTMLLCVGVLACTRQLTRLRRLLGDLRRVALLCAASVVIAANWVVYVFAVMTG
ncbi:MAG: EamA family transporter RarD, partial [Propionibacteriales bacterium]|nr:EamA family transporter RarD [Propionibacteriales bacterium]